MDATLGRAFGRSPFLFQSWGLKTEPVLQKGADHHAVQ